MQHIKLMIRNSKISLYDSHLLLDDDELEEELDEELDDEDDEDDESPARRTGLRPASLSLITLPYKTFSFKQVADSNSR